MMKRRPFLAGLTALGAGSLMSFRPQEKKQTLNTETDSSIGEIWQEAASYTPQVIKQLENDFISFTWMEDATAQIRDKKTNYTWYMGAVAPQEEEAIDRGHVWVRNERSFCEEYPGRFRGTVDGDKIRFMLINLDNRIMGSFTCLATLENEWLTFAISDIDEKLPNLMFPTPIDNDMLLLPMGVGKLIRKPLKSRFFYTWFSHLNMRFVAGLNKDNNGYMTVFDEGFEDAGVIATKMSVFPVWQKSLGKWSGTRTVRYTFTKGGYVPIAKKYREWAKKKGIFKTLTEKIKETPALKNMIGGRMASFYQASPTENKKMVEEQMDYKEKDIQKGTKAPEESPKPFVDYTHKETLEIIKELPGLGMKKGILNIRGWINGGYDYSHPDVWPTEPALGTTEELKAICELKDPFVTVLHDNYMDMYKQNPSFPKGIIIDKNGRFMRGGYWAGGQAYIMNYKDGLNYAKRNWEQIKTLNVRGMFVDTTTAMQLYETYEPGNNLSKADDLKYKIETIKFYKAQKQIFGSEESADFGIPHVDWLENRHRRTAGESVPLWPLVFHDCVMNGRYIDPSNVKAGPNYWLEDMLWGYFILFRIGGKKTEWPDQKATFKSTLHVDDWFGQIGTAEMTNHEYLTEDFEVEKTTFSNGKSIVINFSDQEKTADGLTLKPYSYSIKG